MEGALSRPSVGEDPKFVKSTYSGGGGCLEFARVSDWILLRNSRCPDTEFMRLTLDEWKAFRQSVLDGMFANDSGYLEFARFGDWILLHNSRCPDTEFMRLTLDEWKAFRKGVLNGEFADDSDRP